MWPFKKKQKPLSWIERFALGFIHGQQLKKRMRKELGKRPVYTPSKIITGDAKLDFDLLKEMHSVVSNAANTLNKIKQLKKERTIKESGYTYNFTFHEWPKLKLIKMELKDYAQYYIGCRCFNTWFPESHPEYNNNWILCGYNKTAGKPYYLENKEEETRTNSIKPILRLVDDMTDDDIKSFIEYERITRLYRDVSFSRFMGGITVNYSVETEDEGWYPQSYDFRFHKLDSVQLHRLLKAGFDMFSLIKNGLAIDAKTLK